MKILRAKVLLLVASLAGMSGCASIGPPQAPSLELPRPPSDLRAARKGDKVTLTWTIPSRTMDRQGMRYLGKTRICRSVDRVNVEHSLDRAGVEHPEGDRTLGVDLSFKECETAVGEVAPPANFVEARKSSAKKLTATFTDTLPSTIQQADPTGFAAYGVEVMNEAGRAAGLSNQVRVTLTPTIPPFASFSAQTNAQGVLLSWLCPPPSGRRVGVKYLFRIYRRPADSTGETKIAETKIADTKTGETKIAETKIAELDATDCVVGHGGLTNVTSQPSGEAPGTTEAQDKVVSSFLDQNLEWERAYFYRGTVVSVVESAGKPVEVEGDDTPEVKVFAHDVFPPSVPSGVQAVFSGPGQQTFIDLIWAPVTDADLDGYNVYRHEEGGAAVKVNSELVKTPAYRDMQVVAGKTYFYSVSAVDQRGNESGRSEETSESVP